MFLNGQRKTIVTFKEDPTVDPAVFVFIAQTSNLEYVSFSWTQPHTNHHCNCSFSYLKYEEKTLVNLK